MQQAAAIPLTNPDVLKRALSKARTLRVPLAEYVSRLILQDTRPTPKHFPVFPVFPVEQGWGPVPKPVQEQWDQEVAQAEQAYLTGKQKSYQTVGELMADLSL